MFDDVNENENWDNIDADVDTSPDGQSWDDILDNAVVHEDDTEDENIIDQGNYSFDEQEDIEQHYSKQNYDTLEEDEPVIEISSQSRETDNVSEAYKEDDFGQEENPYQGFNGEYLNDQEMQDIDSATVEDNTPSQSAPSTPKPIGIRQDKSSSKTPAILGVIVAFFIAIVGYLGYTYLQDNDLVPQRATSQSKTEETVSQSSDEDLFEDMSSNQNNEANTEGSFAPVQEQQPGMPTEESEDKVVVSVVNTGRSNPFTPTGNFSDAGYTVPKGLDIMGPPSLDKDVTPNKLVDIVVSGILYDNSKPSAIITIGGIDHFVQQGDSIDEYIVSHIGPNSVTIRSGKNTYTASIGQQFNVNDRIQGETTFVKTKSGVTRQYFTPSSDDIVNSD